jgi:hypothetical protein
MKRHSTKYEFLVWDTNRKWFATTAYKSFAEFLLNNAIKISAESSAKWQQKSTEVCDRGVQFRPFYLDEVIHRWLNILTMRFIVDGVDFAALLFANDQIIIPGSVHKLQEAVYKLSQTIWRYHSNISSKIQWRNLQALNQWERRQKNNLTSQHF